MKKITPNVSNNAADNIYFICRVVADIRRFVMYGRL